jgi:hypothetical protein
MTWPFRAYNVLYLYDCINMNDTRTPRSYSAACATASCFQVCSTGNTSLA